MCSLRMLKSIVYAVLFLFAALLGCKEDSPEGDGLSPSRVSGGIAIESATRQSGGLPAATSDSQSPAIEIRNDTLYLIAGTYTNVFLKLTAGNAAGFYVKVKGSGEYFKVSTANAFKEYFPSGSVGFAITVNRDMPTGPFILQYSAYDDDNRISNIVERPAIISGAPGEGSEFLSATEWAAVTEVWGTGSQTETFTMGIPKEIEFTTAMDCVSEPDKPVTWTQVSGYAFKHYTFNADGSFHLEIDDYYQTLDAAASKIACSAQYTSNDGIHRYDGVWSYYPETHRLIFRQKMADVANVDRFEYTVNVNGENLSWTGVNVLIPVKHTLKPL